MAQYKTGTVSVTNNDANVVGTGTLWLTNALPNDLFVIVSEGVLYTVAAVTDDTNLQLSAPYAGPTDPAASYAIVKDFTPSLNLPYPVTGDIETAAILQRALIDLETFLVTGADQVAHTFQVQLDGATDLTDAEFSIQVVEDATVVSTSIVCDTALGANQTVSAKLQEDGVGTTSALLDVQANNGNSGREGKSVFSGFEPEFGLTTGQKVGFLVSTSTGGDVPPVSSCILTLVLKKA